MFKGKKIFYGKGVVNVAEKKKKKHNRNRCLKIEARRIQTGNENSSAGMRVVSHRLLGEVAFPLFDAAFGASVVAHGSCGPMISFSETLCS